jgi:hypothetical protein
MGANVGEIIKALITTPNYLFLRVEVGDEFIDFVKTMMPSDYEYFREREEEYQKIIKR